MRACCKEKWGMKNIPTEKKQAQTNTRKNFVILKGWEFLYSLKISGIRLFLRIRLTVSSSVYYYTF
jgi:hypothetical protein